MPLNRKRAMKIAVGYMSPRNEAINIFSQQGKVEPGLVPELERELSLKRKVSYSPDWAAEFERLLHAEELEHLITWLTYSGAIVDLIDGKRETDSASDSTRNMIREILREEFKDSPNAIVENFVLTGELPTGNTQELLKTVREAARNLYAQMRQLSVQSSKPYWTLNGQDEYVLLDIRYNNLLTVVELLS